MTLIERSFRERIVIVGATLSGHDPEETDESLDELALLVDTAGADVVGRLTQRLSTPDPAYYIGRGKVEELRDLSYATDCDTVIFDDELSPAQQRNLEKILGRTAIDRTALILDIFAQNAKSMEGKAQVELALLNYRLPRLRGRGAQLSQQVGRIGTRGPGETKLEEDRRRIQSRIARLKRQLAEFQKTRRVQSKARGESRVRNASLIGYTNAGKSSLLNALTRADTLVENRLFATLDTRTRRMQLAGGETFLLSDTVGFIRKLPHQLVEAFRSTLEAVTESDFLIHVVDGSYQDPQVQVKAVREVLAEIGAEELPQLLVVNKCDLVGNMDGLRRDFPDAVFVSALTGFGLAELRERIARMVRAAARIYDLVIPASRGDILARLHAEGQILQSTLKGETYLVTARLEPASLSLFKEFLPEGALDPRNP
ncbi:MAG: GTPase HflX [Actinomycetota bacterium]|nr:GTPase HflX [Actinomycetota bacterium]